MEFKHFYGMKHMITAKPKKNVLGSSYSSAIRSGTEGYLAKSYTSGNVRYSITFYVLDIFKIGHSEKRTTKRLVVPTQLTFRGNVYPLVPVVISNEAPKQPDVYEIMAFMMSLLNADYKFGWASRMTSSIMHRFKIRPMPALFRRELNHNEERVELIDYVNGVYDATVGARHNYGQAAESALAKQLLATLITSSYNSAKKLVHSNIDFIEQHSNILCNVCLSLKSKLIELNYHRNTDPAADTVIYHLVNKYQHKYNKIKHFEHKFRGK